MTTTTEKTLIAPLVNLNGDRKETLTHDLREAILKLHDALGAMAACTPHGRNYQLQPAGVFTQAVAEHYSRMVKLEDVYAEMVAVWTAVEDGKAITEPVTPRLHA